MKCPAGHENPPSATFCMTCGAQVGPSASPESELVSAPISSATKQRGQHSQKRTWAIFAAVGLALLAVGSVVGVLALGGSDDDSKAPDSSEETVETPLLQTVYDECSSEARGTLSVGDDGYTLVIDTRSEFGPVEGLACALARLETPQAIIAQMEATTAMMGVQEAEDGDLHYQFSYHPDNGINMVITDSSEG